MFKSHKVIVPKVLRPDMLTLIHKSHLGIVKSKSMARDVLYWPGMSTDVEETVAKCATCIQNSNSDAKEPMVETDTPDRPWSIVSGDILKFRGQHYLVSVDHYSKWPELSKLDNLSSSNTIAYLKGQIARYGIMDRLITDNGPQFASEELRRFVQEYGFEHRTSSPRYPQSNAQAERAVQKP